MSWNVESINDINEDSLSLITVLEPKIDILILGVGDVEVTPEFRRTMIEFMKKYHINVEVLRTEAACATFNFLNSEGRLVVALLIPPLHIAVNEDDLMKRTVRGNYFLLSDEETNPSPTLTGKESP